MIAWAPAAHAEPDADYRSYVDQARFFLKKGWTEDAREQLELAVATDDGRLDPEAWMLLAKVAYDGHDLGRCRAAADRALVQSRTPDQERQARELLEFVDAQFGTVVVHGAQDGATGRLRLELVSLQLDPDLQAWIDAVAAAVARPVVLPYVLGLPAGEYRLNGAPFTVAAGGAGDVSPPLGRVDWRSTAVEVTASGLGTFGSRAGDLLPAPIGGLRVAVPLGAFDLGLGATVGLQPWSTPTSAATLGTTFSGIGHAGWVVPRTGAFFVRPAVTADVARAPGFGVPCAGGPRAFACDPASPVEQLWVYPPGLAWGGGGELTVSWQDRRRPRSVGIGLQLAGGVRSVAVPAGGDVDVGFVARWTLDPEDRRFLVATARLGVLLRFGL